MRDLKVRPMAAAPAMACNSAPRRSVRARRCRGTELIEFTLVLLPLLTVTFILLDISWAIFTRATLEFAVRAGVRTGITVTGTQATAAGSNLTAIVKGIVQRNSLGLLRGAAGLSAIKVHYYKPPPPGSAARATDVSTDADGNAPLNIMQVTIEGFTLRALLPRFFWWGWKSGNKQAPDGAGMNVSAISADLIEPSRDVPPIGPAP